MQIRIWFKYNVFDSDGSTELKVNADFVVAIPDNTFQVEHILRRKEIEVALVF